MSVPPRGPGARPDADQSLGSQLQAMIERLPDGSVALGDMLDRFGDEGLLLLAMLLTLVFLIPVSIPGVSTLFGAAILLVGLSRLSGRALWLPARLRARQVPADRLRPALGAGMRWVRRMERVSRPYRLRALVDGRVQEWVNNLAFIFAALLLMAPFGFVPFSNTFPAVALLLYAVGLMQRDGVAIVLGHLATVATVVYFSVLIGGGGMVGYELFKWLTG